MSIRDRILEEYRSEGFDPSSKLSRDGDNVFFTCAEKIKFFNADYPNGTIKTEVLMDNNVFATVKATVACVDCTREALGKWYHSNNDVFGMNYLGTAQTVAISKALSLMGYSAGSGEETDPNGSMNIAPEDSAPSDDLIPVSPPMDIAKPGLTEDQAMSTVMYGSPFEGRTIKQIIENGNSKELEALRNQLNMDLCMCSSRSTVAEIILPKLH